MKEKQTDKYFIDFMNSSIRELQIIQDKINQSRKEEIKEQERSYAIACKDFNESIEWLIK